MPKPIPAPREEGFTTTTSSALYWAKYGQVNAPKLLVLHGGPGADHLYLLPQMLHLAEKYDLTNNFMWANDYPHHEGSWPHSAAAIERNMAHLSDDSRAKILGLNAARIFDLTVPAS